MIRDAQVPVNGALWQQVRALAQIHGLDCPETLLEMWIREKLDAAPEIAELVRMRTEARKRADSEWQAKYKKEISG